MSRMRHPPASTVRDRRALVRRVPPPRRPPPPAFVTGGASETRGFGRFAKTVPPNAAGDIGAMGERQPGIGHVPVHENLVDAAHTTAILGNLIRWSTGLRALCS